MKSINRLIAAFVCVMAAVIAGFNIAALGKKDSGDRPYLVEISRAVNAIQSGDLGCEGYEYITDISEYDGGEEFFDGEGYVIRDVDGTLYRIDYTINDNVQSKSLVITADIILAAVTVLGVGVMIYLREKIVRPFDRIKELPTELAKGKLTEPIKEEKSRYFGRFLWGLDMLREQLEAAKRSRLEQAKNEKTMLLSLSHDIKTPLSAIKLYARALEKGIYKDRQKQVEAAAAIGEKSDEIEGYVNSIIKSSSEDFMSFEIKDGEFYMSEVINEIMSYYGDKLEQLHIGSTVGGSTDCMLRGDRDRLVEVLQNIMENAVKYGDGHMIELSFSDEEDCRLITVSNTGCTLEDRELTHIFDSFWRGSNTGSKSGSGLGLYICRRLMHGMGGDIFAEIKDGKMNVTAVCRKVSA